MAKKKKDEGHDETEAVLSELEKEINAEYAKAEEEVQSKLDDYLERFQIKDQLKKQAVENGQITQAEYEQWRVGQIAVGERWEEMKDTIATDLTNTAEIAKSISYGHMPEVYAINHNYGTFQVEKASLVDTSYTLYDSQSVERLFKGGKFYHSPGKLVSNAIDTGKQKAWDKRQVQSVMTQALLQGESIGKIATRLAKTVGDSDRKACIRNARTMTTGVENAGRTDSYKRAEKMGIKLKQEWLATLDSRTRHEHRMLDGQRVAVGEKFKIDGYELEYPGDPSGEPSLIYNCRCTLVPVLDGFEADSKDLSLRHNDNLKEETYDEWKESKEVESHPITKQDSIETTMKNKYIQEYNKFSRGKAGNIDESDEGLVGKAKAFLQGRKEIKELRKDFNDNLGNVYNEKIGTLLKKADKDSVYIKWDKLKSSYSDGVVYVGKNATSSTLAHELFHKIDIDNNFSYGGAFTENLNKDYTRIVYNAMMKNKSVKEYLKEEYPNAFGEKKIKTKYRGLSDIIHGCSKGEVYLGFGHSEDGYWEREKQVEKETFAQSGRIFYDNDEEVVKMYKELFPDVFEEVLEKIKEA